MASSTGTNYEISGDNTEWEDILIKKGITTQESVLLGKGLNPEEVTCDGSLFVLLTVESSLRKNRNKGFMNFQRKKRC
jgi:hypothetical protein